MSAEKFFCGESEGFLFVSWGLLLVPYTVSTAVCFRFVARFNTLSASGKTGSGKEFTGFPIPAAAGLIASITPSASVTNCAGRASIRSPSS